MNNFLQDGKGDNSSTRLVMAAWAIGILVVWVIVSFYNKRIEDIPAGVQMVLGLVLIAKVGQSHVENKPATP